MLNRFINLGRTSALIVASATWLLADGSQLGSIAGSLLDPSGRPIQGATIQLSGPALQGTRTAISGAKGDYRFLILPSGKNYSITITRDGFQTAKLKVDVMVNTATSASITLQPIAGAIVEVVEAPSAKLVTQQTAIQSNVTAEVVEKLPVGRTYQDMMLLTPGVLGGGGQENPSALGARITDNQYLIDGVDTSDPLTGTWSMSMPEDAIEETQVMTTSVSAEYGRFQGAVANVVTKSGGNEFHGSARCDFSNVSWDAVAPTGKPLPSNPVRTPYITLGGYILKDKLWFSTSLMFMKQSWPDSVPGLPGGERIHFNRVYKSDPAYYSIKLTGNINANHSLVFTTSGNPATVNNLTDTWNGMEFMSTMDTTVYKWEGGRFYSLQYRGILGESTTLQVNVSRHDSKLEWTPLGHGRTPFRNRMDGRFYENHSYSGYTKRPRNQVNAMVTHFLEALGSHEIKAGMDYQGTKVSDKFGSPSDRLVLFNGFGDGTPGTPALPDGQGGLSNYNMAAIPNALPPGMMTRFTPAKEITSENKYLAAFVNDVWKKERWTFNIGLRLDAAKGTNSYGQTVWNCSALSPRLSAAYDLKGDGKSSIGVSLSRYSMAPTHDGLGKTNEGQGQAVYAYNAGDPHLDGSYQSDPLPGSVVSPHDPGRIFDPNISVPYSDEFSLSFKKQVSPEFSFQASVVSRESKDSLVHTAYFDKVQDGVMMFQKLENGTHAYRKYRALLTSGQYEKGPFSLLVNYVYSRSTGNLDTSWGMDSSNGYNYLTTGLVRPNYIASNQSGALLNDTPHVLTVYAAFRNTFGKLVLSNAIKYRYASGTPYRYLGDRQVPAAEVQAQLEQGGFDTATAQALAPSVLARMGYLIKASDSSDRESGRFPHTYTLDYSLNMTYPVIKGIEVFGRLDVFNLFNHQRQTSWNTHTLWDENTKTLIKASDHGSANSVNFYARPRSILLSAGLRF